MQKYDSSMSEEKAAIIKAALNLRVLHQHQIAARLNINPGRVSDVKFGRTYKDVKPAAHLPDGFLD